MIKLILKTFLSGQVSAYRNSVQYSQEQMSEILHISPRAYNDLEREKYCLSTLTFIFFLIALPEKSTLKLLSELRDLLSSALT